MNLLIAFSSSFFYIFGFYFSLFSHHTCVDQFSFRSCLSIFAFFCLICHLDSLNSLFGPVSFTFSDFISVCFATTNLAVACLLFLSISMISFVLILSPFLFSLFRFTALHHHREYHNGLYCPVSFRLSDIISV